MKTRSEAQSRVSTCRPMNLAFPLTNFHFFLFFHASILFFWSKMFVFSLSLLIPLEARPLTNCLKSILGSVEDFFEKASFSLQKWFKVFSF